MFIVRVRTPKTTPEVRTFSFVDEKEMDTAVSILRRMSCIGFSAKADSAASTRGAIKDRWDNSNNYSNSLRRTVSHGAYKDHIFEEYGYKDECEKSVQETNDKATCWASRRASLQHVVGDLYKVTYVDPFTD